MICYAGQYFTGQSIIMLSDIQIKFLWRRTPKRWTNGINKSELILTFKLQITKRHINIFFSDCFIDQYYSVERNERNTIPKCLYCLIVLLNNAIWQSFNLCFKIMRVRIILPWFIFISKFKKFLNLKSSTFLLYWLSRSWICWRSKCLYWFLNRWVSCLFLLCAGYIHVCHIKRIQYQRTSYCH